LALDASKQIWVSTDFCAFVTDHVPSSHHIIAANEGQAVALAAGYHLATGKASLVYMQNSGLGNSINPLVRYCLIDFDPIYSNFCHRPSSSLS
jgi:sulfopyruvate decarboxylase TPP-binding subunit